ncbi:MAG: hypothetical protein ACYCO0_00895 [Candidatus Micrarchaeaceae archaeon]
MDIEINVSGLLALLRNERKSGEVIPLPKDFYAKTKEKLGSYEKDTDEYKNTNKIISSIKEKRTQKILVYLAYNKDLPKPVPSEEEDLYIQIKNIINNNEGAKPTKVKITKTIPQIVTPSGSKIGPYEQNETVYIYDHTDTKFIVENKIGETTD